MIPKEKISIEDIEILLYQVLLNQREIMLIISKTLCKDFAKLYMESLDLTHGLIDRCHETGELLDLDCEEHIPCHRLDIYIWK